MPRLGIVHLIALLPVAMTARAPPVLAQAPATPQAVAASQTCPLRQVRAIMSDSEIADLAGCRYDDIRQWLPSFTTVTWAISDSSPLGEVLGQSAGAGTPFSRLQNRFVLRVSAGPAVRVSSPTTLEGETLRFRLGAPLRVPNPFAADYVLALDPSGRNVARAGADFTGSEDRGFLSGGTLDVTTRAGRGVENLYLIVMLTYPPGGPAAVTPVGRGVGRIVPYPRVSLGAPFAREGSPLSFVARIDRSGVPDETIAYRFTLQGDAEPGVDYLAPTTSLLAFPPGVAVETLSIRTLANDDSLEDRLLILSVGGPGQKPATARGTIVNTTVAPTEEPAPEASETAEPAPEGMETAEPGPDATEAAHTVPAASGSEAPERDKGKPKERGLLSLIYEWGEGWLAAIGALALGVLAAFVFGAKDRIAGFVRKRVGGNSPAIAAAPVIGWTTAVPRPPVLMDGTVPIDGPAITIAVEPGERTARHLDTLSILAEGASDE